MNRQKFAVAAFSLILVIATVLGCGTPGQNFLIPTGAGNQFLFAVDAQTDTTVSGLKISAFSLDNSTGKLTPVPNSPFTATAVSGRGNLFMDVDPAGRFLYVPNRDADSVSVFSIASTGALSALGSPVPTNGTDAFAVKVHPSGNYLYVANQISNDITAFSVSASGTLTQIGNPVLADGSVHHMFMDPKGRFLFAAVWNAVIGGVVAQTPRAPTAYAIDAFSISPTDGSLTYVGGVLAGSHPQSGTVDAGGNFLLVTNNYDSTVGVYQINQTSGALTEATGVGSPFSTGGGPFHVAQFASAGAQYMAVSNADAGSISVYTFNSSTGALSASGAPVDLGLSHPGFIAIDRTGEFGYIADGGNDQIVGVTAGTNGEPTPIPGSPFTGGGVLAPVQIVIADQQ